MGAFIKHVDMEGGGMLAKCPYYYYQLFRKMVHKGGGGSKCPKYCPHGL